MDNYFVILTTHAFFEVFNLSAQLFVAKPQSFKLQIIATVSCTTSRTSFRRHYQLDKFAPGGSLYLAPNPYLYVPFYDFLQPAAAR